jgi:hypothetical protein
MLRTSLSVIEVICVATGVAIAIEIVGSPVEVFCSPIEMVAIDDGRAVGNVGVVVEHNSSVSPITSLAVPAPRETRH